jgi:hypothetical protein
LSAVKPAYWISGVLLALAIVLPLLVPMYAKADPHLWGFPFFYWYQLLWVVLTPILTFTAYLVIKRSRNER